MQTANFPLNFTETSNSPKETEALGERIGSLLSKGSVLVLSGALGAGKTCLVKGIARFLKIEEEITSPTYTIISEYSAIKNTDSSPQEIIPFYHIDAYRLNGDDDFLAIGGTEYFGKNGIAVVEWGEIIAQSLPDEAFCAEIEIIDGNTRLIRFGTKV